MFQKKKILLGLASLVAVVIGVVRMNGTAEAFTMMPMKQSVSLVPGDTYSNQVTVFQAGETGGEFRYKAYIAPLTVNDEDGDYVGKFDQRTDFNDIVDWVTLTNGEDTVRGEAEIESYAEVGERVNLTYTINVPKNAKGGGHYFAVVVDTVPTGNSEAELAISDTISIASVVYAEVAGDIRISGVISGNEIAGFMLNPPITAQFVAVNDGNTHTEVTYYLEVTPLFSNEPVYTTEENPSSDYVLPGTTRIIQQTWKDTPGFGFFNVKQVAYYESSPNDKSITERLVVICPIWLIFIIIFALVAVVIGVVVAMRMRRARRRQD